MKRAFFTILITLCCWHDAAAQKGTAHPGFYPMGYHGDTWTGEVTAVDASRREVTLTYRKGEKAETFVFTVPDGHVGWMKDELGERALAIFPKGKKDKDKEPPAELNFEEWVGHRLTVYYVRKEKKVDDKKVKFYEAIRIKPLADKKK